MKTWQTLSVLALSVAIALLGWTLAPRAHDAKKPAGKNVRVARATAEGAPKKAASELRLASDAGVRRAADFRIDADGEDSMNLSFGDDFGFEDEIKEKLSSVIQEIYDQYLAASNREDKKAMLSAIQRLLAKAAAGEKMPVWLKQKMIEGITWVGGSAMPELIAMAADPSADVSSSAIESLQDLLWDFDTTPQQISDAIIQVVNLTTDAEIIEPFMFEMSDMSTQLKVKTAVAVLDSGNATAIECFNESKDFIFDSFDSSIQTREDIIQYGKDHGVDDDVTVSGN